MMEFQAAFIAFTAGIAGMVFFVFDYLFMEPVLICLNCFEMLGFISLVIFFEPFVFAVFAIALIAALFGFAFREAVNRLLFFANRADFCVHTIL